MTTTTDQLDTIQSGITDAYEALCELAEAGDATAEALATKLRETFGVRSTLVPRAFGHGFTCRTVVAAVDAMRPAAEHDDAPHVADGIDAEVF